MTKTQKGGIKLYFILMMMHQFFYLLPQNIGPLSWFNILFLLGGGMIAWAFIRNKGRFVMGNYGYLILVIPVLIVLSAIGGYIHYDQPIIAGLGPQRLWLTTAWSYFVIMYLIRKGEITYDSFVQVIYAVVGTELVIYFAQWFLGEQNMFLNVNYNQRNGLRLYCDPNYMYVLILVALERILKKKNILLNAVYIIAIMMYILMIYKTRSFLLQIVLALGLLLLLNRDIPAKWKIVVLAVGGVCAFAYIWNTEYLRDIVAVVLRRKADPSWNARMGAYQFYIEKWTSTPYSFLFGFGYGKDSIEASRVATGVTQHFLLADNGIVGFVFCYGLVGLTWYAVYLAKIIRSGVQALKKQEAALLARILSGLIAITMGSSFFYAHYSFDMVFLIILAELMESKCGDGKLRFFPL